MIRKILNNWPLVIILVATLATVWPLFYSGYFSHQDDLQVMRIFEMRKCLVDLQIPCRWVSDMGWGNGYPLFNYYSVLPYYFGAVVSYIFGYIWAAKILFLIPLVLGPLSIYKLATSLMEKFGALSASMLFMYAPYRALDTYIRGDITESWAIAIIPLVFYFSLKLIRDGKLISLIWTAVTLAMFLLSHNIMVMLFMPVLIIWLFFWLWQYQGQNLLKLFGTLVLGFGTAAFFLLPAYLEKPLVQIDNLVRGDLNFRAHFVTIYQLFLDRMWGYGSSISGISTGISYQIGWPHWWLVTGVGLIVLLSIIGLIFPKLVAQVTNSVEFPFTKIYGVKLLLVVLLFVVFMGSAFMTHNKSAFIWEKIGLLRFTQFPWRFLAVSIFSSSLLGGFAISALKENRQKYGLILIIILTVALNYNYFHPEKYYFNLRDEQKLSGDSWNQQQKAAILDYLPINHPEPKEPAPILPLITSGVAAIESFDKRTNQFYASINVNQQSVIEFPIFDFPNWQIKVNNRDFPFSSVNYMHRLSIDLQPGKYQVWGMLENTPIRIAANFISLLSILILIVLGVYGKIKKVS